MKKIFAISLFVFAAIGVAFTTTTAGRKQKGGTPKKGPEFLADTNSAWVDSIFKTLTLDEKIAQLIMYPVYSKKDTNHLKEISNLVTKYGIGGVIYMQGGPVRQANFDNHLQKISKVPILTSIDGEWGLAMRLDSTTQFPYQMMLGAIQDDKLIFEMGQEIARQCKELNIHVDFAPVIDINVNPNNPVISYRSFGENKYKVAQKGLQYMKGLQSMHVLASAKHFPGHGDTDKDSHAALPVISHDKERLDSIELYPFKVLIDSGIGSVMVAHLNIPAYDKTKNLASTLSPKVVKELLKKDLGFQGVTFTDALNMKGVSKYFAPGEVDAKALLAGNDILLFSEDIGKAIEQIKIAISKKQISVEEINARCKKVLALKQWCGLNKYKAIKTDSLYERLNTPNADRLNRKLVESAITLAKNNINVLPFAHLEKIKIASLCFSDNLKNNEFQEVMNNYTKVTHFNLNKTPNDSIINNTLTALKDFDYVVIGVHGSAKPDKNFNITQETINAIAKISESKKVILALFANPYVLRDFEGKVNLEALIISYQDNKIVRDYTAQLLFGGIGAKGILPVTCSSSYPSGTGIFTNKIRFKYSIPEEEGMNQNTLRRIDSIAMEGINNRAFPGCQVLVARNGNVVYWKAFGKQMYDSKTTVNKFDIYDIASVTKVTATLPVFMKLDEVDSVSLDMNLCDYLPIADTAQCYNVNLREMLAHQARLFAYIPFFKNTIKNGKLDSTIYSPVKSDSFSIKITDHLFMRNTYLDSMHKQIIERELYKEKHYKYSDLGYYFLKEIDEKYGKAPLNILADSLFYRSMGAYTLSYLPKDKFPLEDIVPSEYDTLFRHQLLRGEVNDPSAAMLGGVAGHAGLFSNSNDLAKMFQMYLNNGEYGGIQYLDSTTIAEYTRCQFCNEGNRRGAGFDKPTGDNNGPTCDCVSRKSYGHTGFTGTLAWADPDKQIVYIFLSNRTYPSPNNYKITKYNIRTRIQQAIYDSMKEQVN